ncbi:MAG TPA: hypothetical protein VGS96_03850 [Thermoanaerobaculia bacterium]|nr:hypothetical protein [Thermoanaerobaculia bacterium]
MKRHIATLLLLLFVALNAGAADTKTSYTCSLTNKTVSKCCCTKKNGELYCTLAKKTVKPCCCKVTTK